MHTRSKYRGSNSRITLLLLALLLPASTSFTQTASEMQSLVRLWKMGNIDELRRQLDSFPPKQSDDPTMLFLHGVTEPNGDKAIGFLQSLANQYPGSEWADDALYRLYQYSYSVGAYNMADRHLSQLKREYPSSPYLGRTPAKRVETTDASSEGSYAVQIAAFSKREDADQLVQDMQKFGYTLELREKQVGQKHIIAVWIGVFPTRDAAAAFANKVKSRHKMDAIVVRR